MYCPFCGSSVTASHGFCGVCGRDITFLKDVANKVPEEMPTTSAHLSAQPSTSADFCWSNEDDGCCLKPVRGRSLPLDVEPQWSCEELLAAAVKKQKAFNQDLEDGAHLLLYPDAREITNIPGTDTPFTVQMYKEAIGKPFQRITFYICTVEAFENSCYSGTTSSDEDSVVHVNLPSGDSLADTLVWDFPNVQSTPRMDTSLPGPLRHPKPASDRHPSVFRAFMCSSVVELTSATLEEVFEVLHSSEKGSSRRHEETRVLGFWRDYLLEKEEKQTGLLLGDILMFSTGLNTLPSSGIQPRPQLVLKVFLEVFVSTWTVGRVQNKLAQVVLWDWEPTVSSTVPGCEICTQTKIQNVIVAEAIMKVFTNEVLFCGAVRC
ncbi:hypothetical protein F7725_009558 [Dissostichus mawsoni]|uniref:Uncharacterized protein n=1 Tax=Dissostichus mawsoni TaxID=36200 RepID=A0A7J5XLA7_DISMA|nr:hypothetical protein F7725_009558 [Dissostichus mawsoni]